MDIPSLWRRLAALSVDVLVLIVPLGIATGYLSADQATVVWLTLFPMIWVAYNGFQQGAHRQATIGQRWARIHVARTDGAPVSLPRACVRAVFKLVFSGPFAFAVLGSTKRRAIHDHLVGTVVVKTNSA